MTDQTLMQRALMLATPMVGKTGDNPAVGCVIALGDAIFGEGATAEGGRPHAEEIALKRAGATANGATAYVTLEPCAERSAGGASCTDLLIEAGVARVVIATADPHPNAKGAGTARLRDAGIVVDEGVLALEARMLNAAFLTKWEKG